MHALTQPQPAATCVEGSIKAASAAMLLPLPPQQQQQLEASCLTAGNITTLHAAVQCSAGLLLCGWPGDASAQARHASCAANCLAQPQEDASTRGARTGAAAVQVLAVVDGHGYLPTDVEVVPCMGAGAQAGRDKADVKVGGLTFCRSRALQNLVGGCASCYYPAAASRLLLHRACYPAAASCLRLHRTSAALRLHRACCCRRRFRGRCVAPFAPGVASGIVPGDAASRPLFQGCFRGRFKGRCMMPSASGIASGVAALRLLLQGLPLPATCLTG